MKIGPAVRALRQERKLKLEEVALAIGTDAGNLSRFERGQQQINEEMLFKLAHLLETTVASLYAAVENDPSPGAIAAPHALRDIPSPEYTDLVSQQMRQAFRELNPDNKKLAIAFLRLLGQMQKKAPLG